MRPFLALCAIWLSLSASWAQMAGDPVKPVIVSKEYPIDSLGETVYANQGTDLEDKAVPVVPGVLVYPPPLNKPKPKFSKAMKKAKFLGTVSVLGVITAQGKVIDLEANSEANPDAKECALDAVAHYHFTAPTLNGNPVAVRFKVVIEFKAP